MIPMLKIFTAATLTFAALASAETLRYEAEDAIPADDHSVEIVSDANASGGSYVSMKEGNLLFTVTVPAAGFYTLWTNYQLPTKSGSKIQNLTVNGSSAGQISFGTSDAFTTIKGAGKIKLSAGTNTIGIVKSWGWVNLDYIELTEYEETPFTINNAPVDPKATESAQKLYSFLYQNFGNHVISGVMTNGVFLNDGKYTTCDYTNQTELAYIDSVSGKNVALVGFDFLHATGLNSTGDWHKGYTHAALEMAKTVWNAGGIPAFNWHWKDPAASVEAFYTESSGNTPFTIFHIGRAYDTTTGTWLTDSDDYKAIVSDIETIADSLLTLQEAGVAILWRPLHEASGKWFWWGTDGAKACVALYKLIFDIFTNQKDLHNLIWVWTTDEAGDALDWYPGDEYVDVVGRDYYYYPREANHSSLVSSFETVKDIYGAKKIIALSENGSVPMPDSMKNDGANWSWFMPWYGDYAMPSWANDNTDASWKEVMNNEYTITLEDMPGWDNYEAGIQKASAKPLNASLLLQGNLLYVNCNRTSNVAIFDVQGNRVLNEKVSATSTALNLEKLSRGSYVVQIRSGNSQQSLPISLR